MYQHAENRDCMQIGQSIMLSNHTLHSLPLTAGRPCALSLKYCGLFCHWQPELNTKSLLDARNRLVCRRLPHVNEVRAQSVHSKACDERVCMWTCIHRCMNRHTLHMLWHCGRVKSQACFTLSSLLSVYTQFLSAWMSSCLSLSP